MKHGINKVFILGNVGSDPELRYTGTGVPCLNISVATSETWKDKNDGQPREQTEWHRIVLFNKVAEICAQYLRKGSKVYIEGKLKTRSYERDGVKMYATEIFGEEVQFLDKRESQQNDSHVPQGGNAASSGRPQASQPAQQQNYDNFDDDIPF